MRRRVAAMRRALPLTPRSPALHMNIANTLFRLGDCDGARAEYETALALDPGAPNILTNYGAFLLARGEPDHGGRRRIAAAGDPRRWRSVGSPPAYRAAGQDGGRTCGAGAGGERSIPGIRCGPADG